MRNALLPARTGRRLADRLDPEASNEATRRGHSGDELTMLELLVSLVASAELSLEIDGPIGLTGFGMSSFAIHPSQGSTCGTTRPSFD